MADGREGFHVSHDDLTLLSCCDPETVKRFVVSLNEYSQWLEDNRRESFHQHFDDPLVEQLHEIILRKIREQYEEWDTLNGIMAVE